MQSADGLSPICERVRSSCAEVVAAATSVRIDEQALAALAAELGPVIASQTEVPPWPSTHFSDDAATGGPLTAQYVFVLDSLNFCFWPSTTALEYGDLSSALARVLRADSKAFSAAALQRVDAATLRSWVAPHDLPAADERARLLRQLGTVLQARWGGEALRLVRAANGSAAGLAALIAAELPGFRDEALYCGSQVALYKRAQIAAADIWAAYGAVSCAAPSATSPAAFADMGELTTFADYRVPQLLRDARVLVYAPALAAAVDARDELQAGCPQEVEIRAATVIAVERLRDAIVSAVRAPSADLPPPPSKTVSLTAVQVDWALWERGEARRHELRPHHRTRTIFY